MKLSAEPILFLFFLMTITFSLSAQVEQIDNESQWNVIKQRSKSALKPVLLDFYTDWCVPCKKMDKLVYGDSSVVSELSKDFLVAKIDAESEIGRKLQKQFNVLSYPTCVFIDTKLMPFYSTVGFASLNDFQKEVLVAAEKLIQNKPVEYYNSQYEAGKRNANFIKEYVSRLTYSGDNNSKYVVLEEYFSGNRIIDFEKAENIELLASYVESCTNSFFSILEQYYLSPNKNILLKLKVARAYTISINNCLKQAIASEDTSLFNKIISVKSRDSTNLDIETSIMNLRVDYYEKTNQKDLLFRWITYYMNAKMKLSDSDMLSKATYGFNKIHKNLVYTPEEKSKFIQNWLKSDIQSMAGDLNYFSQFFLKEHSSDKDILLPLAWSHRACELLPIPEHLDNYAHLLYKANRKFEAIIQQKRAIEAAIQSNIDKSSFEVELNKMMLGKI